MKKLILLAVICFGLVGCSAVVSPLSGGIYTQLKAPIFGGAGQGVGSKEGTATATSILGLVATGDCSIAAAAKNGEITKIMSVDYEAFNILGVYAKFTTIVHGE